MYFNEFSQRTPRLQACSRVVITCYDDCFSSGIADSTKKAENRTLCRCGWGSIVEYIAGHQQKIGLIFGDEISEVLKYVLQLIETIAAFPNSTRVPIACMHDAH
jgi:hypothetical protein